MLLQARQYHFQFPRPALVMGILNVTPDSFSDGGAFFDESSAIRQALAMIAQGADILDIGGESTRPHAVPVAEEEELRRVLPVIRELVSVSKMPIPLSIDTMKPRVATAAVEAGAAMINDVAANRSDREMWQVAAESGAAYVVMHMQGTPKTMQDHPLYGDVVREVYAFFAEQLEQLRECDVKREQTVIDPGIGFGKNVKHNLELLAGLGHFRIHERPLLVGASRKGFIG